MSERKDRKLVSDRTHRKMSWVGYQVQQKDDYVSYPPPLSPSSSYAYSGDLHKESTHSSSITRINPAVLFIIVILAVLLFISGLLLLLVRFLVKHPSSAESSPSNRYLEISTTDALQRQLQQLFHIHDSGLDQGSIDALPVFQYKEIMGAKEPFDCAVCLCEFTEKDKLRLLPMCGHAFHINCIGTWLLSNSTCPLCRDTLFTPEFCLENPISEFDDFREQDECPGNGENGFSSRQKTVQIEEVVASNGVLPVRLGKFRKLNEEKGDSEGETSCSKLDARRCFSMGSYQYVLGNSDLRITLNHDRQDRDKKRTDGNEKTENERDEEAKKIRTVTKGESFSVSKIWLWSKKDKFSSSSDEHMGLPSSFNTELPWLRKTQGT